MTTLDVPDLKESLVEITTRDNIAILIERARHSRSKCMGCGRSPQVAVHWANGHGMAWFCLKHFKSWAKEDDRDIVGVWFIKDGEVPKDIRKNPPGTEKIRKLGQKASLGVIFSRLDNLVERVGKGPGYHDPHVGLPGVHGGSRPRDGAGGAGAGKGRPSGEPSPKGKKKISQLEREAGAWSESQARTVRDQIAKLKTKIDYGNIPVGVKDQMRANLQVLEIKLARLEGREPREYEPIITSIRNLREKPNLELRKTGEDEFGNIYWTDDESGRRFSSRENRWYEEIEAKPTISLGFVEGPKEEPQQPIPPEYYFLQGTTVSPDDYRYLRDTANRLDYGDEELDPDRATASDLDNLSDAIQAGNYESARAIANKYAGQTDEIKSKIAEIASTFIESEQRRDELPQPGIGRPGVYVGVPETVVPIGTDAATMNGMGIEQPSGAPIRGDSRISPEDERIPEHVYHMTTALSGIENSNEISAWGAGGLGGDEKDYIVSMTLEESCAKQLTNDMRMVAELAREFHYERPERGTTEHTEWAQGVVDRINELDAEQYGGWRWHGAPEQLESIGVRDLINQYFWSRETNTKINNPLLYTDPETLMNIDPSEIGYVRVPKENLSTGALLMDFDLDNPYGLQEIRLYGDLPLDRAEFFRGEPFEDAYAESYRVGVTRSDLARLLSGKSVVLYPSRRVITLADGPFAIIKDYPDPHCGLEGTHGGSRPRGECAAGTEGLDIREGKYQAEGKYAVFEEGKMATNWVATPEEAAEEYGRLKKVQGIAQEQSKKRDEFIQSLIQDIEFTDEELLEFAGGRRIKSERFALADLQEELDIRPSDAARILKRIESVGLNESGYELYDMSDVLSKALLFINPPNEITNYQSPTKKTSNIGWIDTDDGRRFHVHTEMDVSEDPWNPKKVYYTYASRTWNPSAYFAIRAPSMKGLLNLIKHEEERIEPSRGVIGRDQPEDKKSILDGVRRSLENLVEKVLGIERVGKGPGYHAPHVGLSGVHGGSAPREGGAGEEAAREATVGMQQENILENLPEDLQKALRLGNFDEETIRNILDVAKKKVEVAIEREPELTTAIQALAEEYGGEVAGLDYRLKGEDSMARKVATDMVEKGLTHEEAVADITDAVRYTMIFDPETLVEQVAKVQNDLMDQGYSQYDHKWKNYFPSGDGYDGYNTVMINNETGERFELQFHTQESWDHKMATHDLYAQLRVMDEDDPGRLAIWNEMVSGAERITKPSGWEQLRGEHRLSQ